MASILRHGWHELQTAADAWQLDPREISPRELRARCLSWLSSAERAQHERLRSEQLRHDYLATRALCRAALSHYTGVDPSEWRFGTNAHGKPAIAGPSAFESLRFNVTHTRDLVICLISRAGEVGVDAEDTSRAVDVEQMARHFATRREQMRSKDLPAPQRVERFFEQWVLREAYLKGVGTGIAQGPERFAMTLGDDGQPAPIGDWQFFLHRPSANHVTAAAVRGQRPAQPVTVRWLNADELLH